MASHQESAISDYEATQEDQKLRKLRVLNLRNTIQEEMRGLLTIKKAFIRWVLIAKPSSSKKLLTQMFKNSRITPSKAIWIMLSKSRPSEDELNTLNEQKRIEMGLMILISIFKKVLYRNKHHYFFQGRLLFLRRPLIYFLIRGLQLSTLAAFKKLRENRFNEKFINVNKGVKFLNKRVKNSLIDAFWRIKTDSFGKRKNKVQFKIDSLDDLSLKSCQVVWFN